MSGEAGELTRTHAREGGGTTARVVVVDDGHDIVLRSYRGADLLATIELPPHRAVALVADLAQAASRHLSRAVPDPLRQEQPTRRGGDPRAGARANRNEIICVLASLMGDMESAEAKAREIIDRLRRFRPMSVETDPARLLMRKIVGSGVDVPGVDRLARIIRSGEQSVSNKLVCLPMGSSQLHGMEAPEC